MNEVCRSFKIFEKGVFYPQFLYMSRERRDYRTLPPYPSDPQNWLKANNRSPKNLWAGRTVIKHLTGFAPN